MVRHYKTYGWVRQSVLPVEDDGDMDGLGGVVALARNGGEMAERFGQFCQQHLCMESWDFIDTVVEYEMVSTFNPYIPSEREGTGPYPAAWHCSNNHNTYAT